MSAAWAGKAAVVPYVRQAYPRSWRRLSVLAVLSAGGSPSAPAAQAAGAAVGTDKRLGGLGAQREAWGGGHTQPACPRETERQCTSNQGGSCLLQTLAAVPAAAAVLADWQVISR